QHRTPLWPVRAARAAGAPEPARAPRPGLVAVARGGGTLLFALQRRGHRLAAAAGRHGLTPGRPARGASAGVVSVQALQDVLLETLQEVFLLGRLHVARVDAAQALQ